MPITATPAASTIPAVATPITVVTFGERAHPQTPSTAVEPPKVLGIYPVT